MYAMLKPLGRHTIVKVSVGKNHHFFVAIYFMLCNIGCYIYKLDIVGSCNVNGIQTHVYPYWKCCACNMHVTHTLHAYMTVTLMLHASTMSVNMTCMLQ